MKTHTIKGCKLTIIRDEVIEGYAELPDPGKEIFNLYVAGNLSPRQQLLCVIHEFLHAHMETQDHEAVEPLAADLGDFLWRWGYRRKE